MAFVNFRCLERVRSSRRLYFPFLDTQLLALRCRDCHFIGLLGRLVVYRYCGRATSALNGRPRNCHMTEGAILLFSLFIALLFKRFKIWGHKEGCHPCNRSQKDYEQDGAYRIPNDNDGLEPEIESKWAELTGEETLWAFRQGIEFNPDQQIVSYYYRESHEGRSCGLFVWYDRQCRLTVGDWGPLN